MSHPHHALMYRKDLTPYEVYEIARYKHVFYVAPGAHKIPATMKDTSHNHGYDDQDGAYHCIPHDHIAYRLLPY